MIWEGLGSKGSDYTSDYIICLPDSVVSIKVLSFFDRVFSKLTKATMDQYTSRLAFITYEQTGVNYLPYGERVVSFKGRTL